MTKPSAILDDVTVIIVTYNSQHVLPRSLPSLQALKHVIVVDNASTDNTVTSIRHLLPHAVIIQNTVNIGFGRANNLGLAQVTTPYSYLLNPDCTTDLPSIETLCHATKRYPEAAILAPKLYAHSKQFCFDFRPFFNVKKNAPLLRVEPCGDLCADWIIGAALFFNMHHMKKVGFFDPWFFLYYEEEDLCMRTRRAGHSIIIIAESSAIHTVGQSSTPNLRGKIRHHYCMTLSRLYITRKYFGLSKMLPKAGSILLGGVLRLPFYFVLFQKQRFLRNLGRVAAVLCAPFELNSKHCLEKNEK
jgi:N-acetylglucosaminyl-diphospho-decaprenol L-rhamnosyltransferase